MADDQVTIDPQFSPPPAGDGMGRPLRFIAIVAVAVAAFAYGWLLRSPSPSEPEQREAAVTTSTTSTEEAVASSSTTRPLTTTTTEVPAVVALGVPLGEAVPGFTDTITMEVWSEAGMEVMRWRPSEPAAEVIASFRDDELGTLGGIDASGSWYAVTDENGVLSARPLFGTVASVGDSEVGDPRAWSSAFGEAIAVRATAVAWHDTEPGLVAWVACWGEPGSEGALYTLDVANIAASPVLVGSVERACGENVGMWFEGWGMGAWLEGWGDWGFALARWDEERLEFMLLNTDAAEVTSIDDASGEAGLFAGPGGAIVRTGRPGLSESPFMLSVDGQRRNPVPGIAAGDWVDDARWSPDGSLLALSLRRSVTEDPVIRIVEVATGVEIAEIFEPDREMWPMAWSTDGRFFFYGRSGNLYEGQDGGDDGDPSESWVLYDTETGAAQAISLPGGWYVGEIRTSEVAPPAEYLTPVMWGISIDQEGPGVHLVDMIVDVRPLTPDQVDGVSGRLLWDETVIDLCRIEIREVGVGFVHVGDIFGTNESCEGDPGAMQDAFDEFGLPETACVTVTVDGTDHDYCAPLA